MKKENLLNNFIVSAMTNQKNAEKNFNLWKDDYQREQQATHAKKMLYLQNHYQPRLERQLAVDAYIDENSMLRKEYYKTHKRVALHKWLNHSANIPEQLTVIPSPIYTFLSQE